MTKFSPPFLEIISFEDEFILIAVLDQEQFNTIRETTSLNARVDMSLKRHLIMAVLSADELQHLVEHYEPLSRSWRGRYQALAKGIVRAYRDTELSKYA